MSYPFDMTISLNQLTIEPKGKDDKPKTIDLTSYIGNIAESVNLDLAQPELTKQDGHYTIDDCKPTVRVRFPADTLIGNISWQNDACKNTIWNYVTNSQAITAVLTNGLTIIKSRPDRTATESINLNWYIERAETSISVNIDTIADMNGTVYIPQKHLFTVTAEFKPQRLTVGTVEPYTYNQ